MSKERRLNIKAWAEADRPREKFAANGKSSCSDADLLAILIGSGNKEETAVELSKKILKNSHNNLNELGQLELSDLMKFKGIGMAKAVTIAAALELGRRRKGKSLVEKPFVDSSQKAFEIISDNLSDLKHEEFWVILLNNSNQLIEKRNISKGGVAATIADAKLIFKAAIEKLASAIILCHNHPSGQLKASQQDLKLTHKLVAAGKSLDIAVVDHLIIGNNQYLSFSDQGLL